MEGGIVTFFTIYAMIIVLPCAFYNMVWILTQEDKTTSASYMTMTNTLREDVDIIGQYVNNISDAMAKMELLMVDMANKYKDDMLNVDKLLLKTNADVSKLQKSNVSEFEVFANKTLKKINMSTAALEDRLEMVNKSMKLMESTETEINEAIKAHKEIVDIVINETYNTNPKVLTGTFIVFLVIILGMYMYLQSKMTAVLEDAVRVQLNLKMKEYIQRTVNYEPVNKPINGSDTA